VYVKTNDLAMH